MASSRQIEHLERKHNENPQGLTFAPLANAYRNSGQPERAIEILTQGLEHHPDHAPARIVLGRCHLDLGDDAAAEAAFARVLELDKENVVALKALADITERASRFDDAARWLGYLLEVDRNNDEAREQLARVNSTKAIAEEAGQEEPPVAPWSQEASAEPESAEQMDEPDTPAAVDPLELEVPWGQAAEPAPEAVDEPVSPADEPLITPPPSPWQPPEVMGEVTEGLGSEGPDGPGGPAADVPVSEATDAAVPEGVVEEEKVDVDFDAIDTEDSISLTPAEHNEFQMPDAAEGLSLSSAGDSEFQVEQDSESWELHASEHNEFQRPSDAELLSPSAEEEEAAPLDIPDAGLDSGSAYPADAEAGSWFSPASEESAAQAMPESQPDGTPEPLEESTEPEPPAAPFEEAEPLPSHWGPAGGVEDVREEAEEPLSETVADVPDLELTPDIDAESATEPGALLDSDSPEEESGPGDASTEIADDLYPEVLGSDQEEAAQIEVAPTPGAEPEPEPAIVATETMAEVYLSQGHRLEALEVYRTLLLSTPGDARLSEKVNALEKELEGTGAVGGDLAVDSAGDGGETVRDMFRGLLSARPPMAAPAPAAEPMPTQAGGAGEGGQEIVGEPTRPAQDALSLSAVFGEDSSPVPPAVGGGEAEAGKGEGFSFDSFFGGAEGGKDPKRPSAGPPKSREDEEDLDQFQAWLQGLKG